MIKTECLTKVYAPWRGIKKLVAKPAVAKTLRAVDNVTLEIRAGELFCLLGPNGAGKTTLVKLLCTLLLPTSGRAAIGDFDVARRAEEIKQLIGFVSSEEKSFYWRLTGRQNLNFFGRLQGVPSGRLRSVVHAVLETVGLGPAADNMVYTYSTGMRQKLCLARGLLHEPEVLFLDEPLKAIDPLSAIEIKRIIRDFTNEKKTVVMTTHSLAEAEEMADRLAIMARGRVAFAGTLAELRLVCRRPGRDEPSMEDMFIEVIEGGNCHQADGVPN